MAMGFLVIELEQSVGDVAMDADAGDTAFLTDAAFGDEVPAGFEGKFGCEIDKLKDRDGSRRSGCF